MTPEPGDVIEAALAYAQKGWVPVPVKFREKKPTLENWPSWRPTTPQQIRSAFQGPHNVGLLLGPSSDNLADIDLDTPEAVTVAKFLLPPTMAIFGRQTKRRSHYLYRSAGLDTVAARATTQFRDHTGTVLLELRGGGALKAAQTVLPPSIHVTGEPINWDSDGEPAEVEPKALLRAARRVAVAALLARCWPAQGGRHEAALRVGGLLSRAGLTVEEVGVFVQAICAAAGDDEPEDRIRAAQDSAGRKANGSDHVFGLPACAAMFGEAVGARLGKWLGLQAQAQAAAWPEDGVAILDPWDQPVGPPFPLDALQEALRGIVDYVSRSIGVDPAAAAMAALAAVSGAVDHRFKLRMTQHTAWTVTPGLWILLVGDPARQKSPVIRTSIRPILEAESRLQAQYRAELAEYEARKDNPFKPEKPKAPNRYVVGDVTAEKVAEIMANQERAGLLLHADELSGFIGAIDRYSGGGKAGLAARGFYVTAYDGGPAFVDRISRGSLHVKLCSLSVISGVQPERLQKLGDLTSDGLLQRFLPVMMAPPSYGADVWDRDGVVAKFEVLIEALLQRAPEELRLSPEALAISETLRKHLFELAQASAGLGAAFQAFVGKLARAHGSLMLCLHLAGAKGPVIQADTARNAARIVEEFVIPHGLCLHQTIAGKAQEELQALASYILTSDKDRLTPSDLKSGVYGLRSLSHWELAQRVSVLVAGGWLIEEPQDVPGPARAWGVNPSLRAVLSARRAAEVERKARLKALLTQRTTVTP